MNGRREYDYEWCNERHDNILIAIDKANLRVDKVDNKYNTIILLLVGNLFGLLAIFATMILD